MKTIIYGQTGCGKSYTFIAPILRDSNNLIYITPNGMAGELKYMGIKKYILTQISSLENYNGEFGRCVFDYSSVPAVYRDKALKAICNYLEMQGYSSGQNVTIVFSGCSILWTDREFVRKIEKWNADVVLEYTCRHSEIHSELDYIFNKSLEWKRIPVFCRKHKLMNDFSIMKPKLIKNAELITQKNNWLKMHNKAKRRGIINSSFSAVYIDNMDFCRGLHM